ncbi:MAG: bifunctional phosphoglucose/phosphomannose isomerase [Vicingaceae bacterium]|nr:bifunctional phosphoglucose/phosphomannose isomerase [Vicingaceae bacterium]
MKNLIEDFTKHIQHAINSASENKLSSNSTTINNVLICGLGGSGIGATIIAQIVAPTCAYPILVNKDYKIPAFVNENTLVVVCSYSGNTEESIEMLALAEQQNAIIACITSGGKLAEIASQKKYNCILIPSGHPPRAAFGLAFPPLFQLLAHYNIIENDYKNEFESAIKLINSEEAKISIEAKNVAKKLIHKIPVIYAEANYEGVAVRFRQQINENSKMLCWHHVIPEMNHNELVGWTTRNEDLAVVIFRNEDDYFRNQKRIEVNKTVFEKYTSTIIEIHSKGNTRLERALYLIHLGDWVSYLIAEQKGIDVTEVNVITSLKNALAKI